MTFGYELIIDLKECSNIDRDGLERCVIDLCELIEMKRYGPCKVVWFGDPPYEGFTVVQLITTSSITGHFTEREGYMNIFSCKKFDIDKTVGFVSSFFNTDKYKYEYLIR